MFTRLLRVASNNYRSTVWNLCHVNVLAPRISRLLLDFFSFFLENLCIFDLEVSGSPNIYGIGTILGRTYIHTLIYPMEFKYDIQEFG